MKKTLVFAAALLCSGAAYAQTPAADAQRADKLATERPHDELTVKNREERPAAKLRPANHGQTVSAVAQGTPLTGADKGAAVSAVASRNRSATPAARPAHSARGERSHGSHATATGHQSGRQTNNGRHIGH